MICSLHYHPAFKSRITGGGAGERLGEEDRFIRDFGGGTWSNKRHLEYQDVVGRKRLGVYFQKVGWGKDRTDLPYDRGKWWNLLDALFNFQALQYVGISWLAEELWSQ